ncbi:tRNA1(Val) (adenine(37)-N6)-methyltransferase [Magnetospirillum sp. SS-4]|uniref:tRNA1(Val) (adenine(37)-N6)-methyltransferase n=1 Tax=Magnetospirillum sp. SS-4 TaxID=2681465 RepID=UPI001381832A|nr:methyltransferase [Magnetospirillum sp. SS-4]CAA7613717.1 Predicted O-methyltransferase [Magnetospirillum sp. SS-4]
MPFPPAMTITEDRLLDGTVILHQPADGYRAAIDPVLLAAAVSARNGDHVLDLGCGVGAAALCLLARHPDLRVTGLEIQPALAMLARINAEANGRAAEFKVVEGSAAAPSLDLGPFDHVMTNPPFHREGRGTSPPGPVKAVANVEGDLDLAGWIKAAVRLLRPKGRLSVIHRADRLGDLLAALAGRGIGEVRILPLWPKPDRPAGRVIVRGRKGSKAPMELLPGLVLHRPDGAYADEAEAILRGKAGLIP